MHRNTTSNATYIVGALALFIVIMTAISPASANEALCLVDASANIDPDDALTVADVVCQDVRTHGVAIAAPSRELGAHLGTEAFRVKLRVLGDLTVLTLSHEDASGAVLRSEHLQLAGLEDVIALSPRLAESITSRVPIAETATVTTLDHADTRHYDKKPGELLWGLSVEGVALPSPFVIAPGAGLHAVYEMPTAALAAKASFHVLDGPTDAGSFNISLGGRHFFGQSDTALFAGGGLAWTGYYADKDDDASSSDGTSYRYEDTSYEGQGMEAFAEVGLEMFRFHEARVLVDARLSLPFYTIDERDYASWSNPDGTYGDSEDNDSHYLTPVTLGATVLW